MNLSRKVLADFMVLQRPYCLGTNLGRNFGKGSLFAFDILSEIVLSALAREVDIRCILDSLRCELLLFFLWREVYLCENILFLLRKDDCFFLGIPGTPGTSWKVCLLEVDIISGRDSLSSFASRISSYLSETPFFFSIPARMVLSFVSGRLNWTCLPLIFSEEIPVCFNDAYSLSTSKRTCLLMRLLERSV